MATSPLGAGAMSSGLAVRVEASTVLPGGSMAGPYPGHLLLGYLLTDAKTHTHVLKIKQSNGRLTLDHPDVDGDGDGATPSTWLAYVAAARDRHEQTVEAVRDGRGLVYYRTVRDLKPGEELAVWYADDLARDAGIPILTPANIRGNQEYSCTRCSQAFQYPNSLKAHMRFHCPASRLIPAPEAFTSPHTPTGSAFTALPKHATPPTGKNSGIGSGGVVPRALFPESPSQIHMLLASNPLLRYYMQYPLHHPMHPQHAHAQILHAYKSLYSMPPPPAHQPVRLTPPEASPPSASSAPPASYFPMPSDKDGEPLDLLPKSLYMNKSRKGHLCIYCGKLYSRKYGLKIHLRTHTGYKPLKCKVCLRPFGDPSNLNKHIRLHAEGETPYRCDYCGKVLVRRRDLERHVKSRHPAEVGHFEAKRLVDELQNKSVEIDANDNELDETDETTDPEEEEDLCAEEEIEVD